MKRIDSTGAAASHWTEGNPGTGTPATVVSADYMNILMEEIAGVIEYSGQTLDSTHTYDGVPAHDCTQLRKAIVLLMGAGSGSVAAITSAASPYTALATKKIIPVDTSGGAVTVNLPAAATYPGELWRIGKTTGDVNAVTVDANGAETINGELTQVIDQQYTWLNFLSLGSLGWVLV